MQAWRRDARFLRNDGGELVQCRHLAAGQYVSSSRGSRHFPAQPEPLDEIVDVGEVIKDVAAAEDHEPPSRDPSKELQQPTIPGAVNPRRSGDHDLNSSSRGGLTGHALTFQFRDLVDVAGTKR